MQSLGQESLELLAEISRAVVQLQKKLFGKGPEKVKSYFLDDMLVVVCRDGFTTAERTMLDAGQKEAVREFRRRADFVLQERLAEKVTALTGRTVVACQSQVTFNPDRVIAICILDETTNPPAP